nr:MAG TPA: hypothetical protein [Caudoviricetes sp.]
MKIGLIDVDGHNFPNLPLMKFPTGRGSSSLLLMDTIFQIYHL